MNSILRRIAAKGYGWYLAMKLLKAAVAAPLFVVWVALMFLAAALLGIWHAGRAVIWVFPQMLWAEIREFWDKPWFRCFGRAHYDSLYHPTPQEVPDA